MLAPFECLCGNFILPEPASYVFFYAFSNLRNLLYIIFMEDIEDFIGEASISQSISDVEDYVIMQSQLEALQSIWPRLDMRSRYILEAKYILEKSDKEIADELHIKPQSVRMALTRARKNAIELLRKMVPSE